MARSELLWACNSPLPHIRDGPHHQDLPPPPPPTLLHVHVGSSTSQEGDKANNNTVS